MNRRQFHALVAGTLASGAQPVRKERDVVIYRDEKFYSTFPSIIRRPDGELVAAFRRAPDRRIFGGKGVSHTDPNSYLVLVRSRDAGNTWTREPELISAHPFGGSQDPCMLALRDRSIICASYAWLWRPESKYDFLGGYLIRSEDGGRSWQSPIIPPPVPNRTARDPFGKPLPAYNRGAMCEGRDGRLYWAVAYPGESGQKSGIHLMISADGGRNWRYSCPIAVDDKVEFNETSLCETVKGVLVAFVRTANFDDHTVVVRSSDGGKTFGKWEDAGFQGHPHHALRLPDGRVWLVYGYRHQPFGIRGRMLDPECTAFDGREILLRDDGGTSDLGYPWSVLISRDRLLSVYYFNTADGVRHIAGTFLAI